MIATHIHSFTMSASITGRMSYRSLYCASEEAPTPIPASHQEEPVSLSPRQVEVLTLLVQGFSNKQIARSLGLAQGTVKIHVAVLFHKLGVTSRTAAAVAGARLVASNQPAAAHSLGRTAEARTYAFGPRAMTRAA